MDTAAPARATRALLPAVLGDDPALARDAAARLHGVLSHCPILTLRTLDRSLREPGQRSFLRLHIEDIDALGEGDFRASLLGIASVQRDGRLREVALSALRGLPGHLVLGFVLNRLNDPYPPLRVQAGEQARARIQQAPLPELIRCLPLIDALGQLRHADGAAAVRLTEARLSAPGALLPAFSEHDPQVRRSALEWGARLWAGEAPIEAILSAGLQDAHPAVRIRAAALACARAVTPRPILSVLLPLLIADGAPQISQLALQALAREGGCEDVLREAAFDRNAGTRFLARRYLRRRGIEVDFRGEALDRLRRGVPREAVITALSVLSEFGSREDIVLVEALVTDPRLRVRREARRTRSLLGAI